MDWQTELDYTNNPYQDDSEQLYQYFLRSAAGPGNEDWVANGLTIPQGVYANALSDVINTREGRMIDREKANYVDPYNPYDEDDGPPEMQRPANKNLALRDADHGLQSQRDWYDYHAVVLPRTLLYNALKWLAQNTSRMSGIPEGLDAIGRSRYGQRILGTTDQHPFTEASPPSPKSVMWGLRPFWGKN